MVSKSTNKMEKASCSYRSLQ